jgi:hypothetical protein
MAAVPSSLPSSCHHGSVRQSSLDRKGPMCHGSSQTQWRGPTIYDGQECSATDCGCQNEVEFHANNAKEIRIA